MHAGGEHVQEPVLPVCLHNSSHPAHPMLGSAPGILHCVVSACPVLGSSLGILYSMTSVCPMFDTAPSLLRSVVSAHARILLQALRFP
eukprot:1152605-Pelagomonas_calceolata.AAC.2